MVINKDFWKNIVASWLKIETEEDRQATFSFAEMMGNMVGTSENKVKSLADELFGEE